MSSEILLLSGFGEILKAGRKRKRMTQKQLAQLLGVHYNTVSSWELGTYLPETRGQVLELARHLELDEQESRQFLEASLTAVMPHWQLPYSRNPFFTGREELLHTLHRCLCTDQAVVFTQAYALHGLGGIGKTQLAIEYAYRYALEYTAVFWIVAESVETLLSSFLAIADVLQLPERDQADQLRVVAAVQRWLSSHNRWLLIWDNLEDLDLLQRFLPPARQGAMLVTTQRQSLGIPVRDIDLAPMEPEEGILFVLRRAKALGPDRTSDQLQALATYKPSEYAAARQLATVLGGLPLALDQAGAYIEETGCSLSDYLLRYDQRHTQLLSRRGVLGGGNHPHSVTTTFRLSYECMEREQPTAAALLRLCACLHAEAIPEEVFVTGALHLDPELASIVTDPYQFDMTIAALRTLSLVQRRPETHTLSIHRLVQAVLWEQMGEQERAQWQQRAIRMLNTTFPEITHEVWQQCERLLPHVLTCAATIPDQDGGQELANVLRKAANYLRERAQYKQAEPLYQRALTIQERALGPEHPQVAALLNGLAVLYYEQGKYEQAEPLYQRALTIQEQALGLEHPEVAILLNSLSALHWEQGKYEQAEPLYQRALHIWERALGPEHPDVATALNGLALLQWERGKYEQAESLYQRALHIWEQALGPEHPMVARPLNGLALLYRDQRRYKQAMSVCQRALSIREQALGPEHPMVAASLSVLAHLYCEQVIEYEQAEALYRRALRIMEQSVGATHPQIAVPLNGLANLYRAQEEYAKAEPLYRQALTIQEQAWGSEHPMVAQTLHDFAIFHQQQSYLVEATSLYERALAIRARSLGDSHPKTVATRTLYVQLLQDLGRANAESLT